MTGNVTKKLNSRAQKTRPGTELNAYLKNGFATGIQTAWTEPMKTRRCIPVLCLLLALLINLLAVMDVALTW